MNLPKDKPIKENLKMLSRFVDNSGGKVVNYCDGCALVRFGCQEDLIRAYRRLNGHMIYEDMSLMLIPIPEPLNEWTDLQEFNICKSVVKGLDLIRGRNEKDFINKMIDEWNDPKIDWRGRRKSLALGWTAYEPKTAFTNRIGSIGGHSDSGESQCSYYSTTSSISYRSNTTNGSHTHKQTTRNPNSDK